VFNEGRAKKLWRLLAYLGRFGHQPVDVTLALPFSQLRQLADSLSEVMEQEFKANASTPYMDD